MIWVVAKPLRYFIDHITEISTVIGLITGSYKQIELNEDGLAWLQEKINLSKNPWKRYIGTLFLKN